MNKKIIKKIMIAIILVIILFIVYKLIKTYAVFYSEGNGSVEQSQANWIIKVNNTNISSGVSTQFAINQIDFSSSTHILPNNIAPGLEGYFYLTIDPTDTDVSVRYNITFDTSVLTNSSITISSIQETQNGRNLIQSDKATYVGIMPLSEVQAGKKDTIKVTVSWTNNEDNNSNDTIIGTTNNPSINIPVTVNVIQYLGETINSYTP